MNIRLLLVIGAIVCFALAAVGVQPSRCTNAGLALFAGSFLA
jgi:hypothetical protein